MSGGVMGIPEHRKTLMPAAPTGREPKNWHEKLQAAKPRQKQKRCPRPREPIESNRERRRTSGNREERCIKKRDVHGKGKEMREAST